MSSSFKGVEIARTKAYSRAIDIRKFLQQISEPRDWQSEGDLIRAIEAIEMVIEYLQDKPE